MPKQRGGWKGKPKNGKPSKVTVDSDEDNDMYDEIDKHHNKRLGKLQEQSDQENDEDMLDEAPVFDMKRGDSDDDEDDDDDDDAGAYDEEEDDDSDDGERRDAAIAKENKLLTAWGSKRSAFYDNDAEVEIDEEAAAAEEEEAIRIQKKRAAELDEDDLTFGTKQKKKAAAEPEDTMGNRLTNKSAKKASAVEDIAPKQTNGAVERVAKDLTNLTKQQKLEIVMADTPELLGLLDELKAQVAEVRNTLAPILTAVASGKIKTTKGISFLEAKQQILLAYIADITFYLLLKAEGASVRDHPVIGQLVHIRTLLEKMRPLDAKMAHQVSRLLKAAKAAPSTSSKAAAAHVDSEQDDADEEEEELEKTSSKRDSKSKSKAVANKELDDAIAQLEGVTEEGHDAEITGGVFKPLRRTAVMYDDDPGHTKQQKQAERRKKKISESALLADLRAAYTDAPEEAAADGGAREGPIGKNAADAALDRIARERQEYEEEAFTRVQVSKDERKARKARERERSRWDNLADLEQFGDIEEALAGDDEAVMRKKGRSLADLEKRTASTKARAAHGIAMASKSKSFDDNDDDFGGDDYDSGAGAMSGSKRKRGNDYSNDAGSDAEEDPFYAAVEAAARKKKARKEGVRDERVKETSEYIKNRPDEDELHDAEGHRKASRTILQNRGLVKYRSKEDKNPRAHYRKKAEKAVMRRKGQVVPMRDSSKEAGIYGGESTGIRTTVSHSRKIRN